MKKILFFLGFAVLVVAACKKVTDLGEAPRIFRPVISGALSADSNTINAAWLNIDGVKKYEIQLSRDTFRSVDVFLTLDTNRVAFKKLLFNQLYQIQVRAIATDTAKNSGWSDLGAIKTLSSILKTPGISDITFNSVRVSWATKGALVSSIKILKTSDSSVITTVSLTSTDVTNENKIINGLTADTKYTIFLYSGTDVRGSVDFNTKAPFAGTVIDLTGITGRPSVLSDTLPLISSGSILLLKRGETYNIATTINFNKSVTMMSGPDLTTNAQAKIYLTSNFSITSSSTIDYIDFKDVYLQGAAYGSNYVINSLSSGSSANIGRISFDGCKAEIFRGLVRTQGAGSIIISNFVVNNCIVDSLSGFGVLTMGQAAGKVDNVSITSSTFYKVEKIVTSSASSGSILIDQCTVNETPISGSYYVDYGTTNTVTNGITVSNCIFGTGKNGVTAVRGIRAVGGTSVTASNNYKTADQTSGGSDIPGLISYSKTSTQIWQDPLNGNFKLVDAAFPGKNTTGDPRWR